MFVLRDYQKEAVYQILMYLRKGGNRGLAVLPTGCHAKGHKILMYDGSTKKVEDIEEGDQLFGPDSTPRTVLGLHRGEEEMFKITLRNGLEFTVNKGHILQLYRTGVSPKNKPSDAYERYYPSEVSVTLGEYLDWAKSRKHLYKIKRAGVIDFPERPVPIDPYFLGIWLGDGTAKEVSVTTPDPEIIEVCQQQAEKYGLKLHVNDSKKCPTYRVTAGRGKNKHRPLREKFKNLDLFNNKHVPEVYLHNSVEVRSSLLCGLIDTDGHLDKFKNRYEITVKQKPMAIGIYQLANSLGLQASLNDKWARAQSFKEGEKRLYYRVSFRCSSVLSPILDKNKPQQNYKYQGDGSMYSFSVNPEGKGEYFGFSLDKDHLYLDIDQIIHHNSGKSLVIAEIGGKASIFSASANSKKVGNVTYATPGSIKNHPELFEGTELVIIDEAHRGTDPNGMMGKFIKAIGGKDVPVIGMTATPLKKVNRTSGIGSYWTQLNMLNRMWPKFWKDIIHVTHPRDLLDRGYLSEIRYTSYKFNMRNAGNKGSDFDLQEVSDIANKYGAIDFAARVANKGLQAGKKKVLVFTPTVEDAYAIEEKVPKSRVISSKTKKKDRKKWVEEYIETDNINTLINYGTLTTGFDCPQLDLIVCARPTQSYVLWSQIVGRGVRIAEGKELCDFVDLSENYPTFGCPSDMRIEDIPGFGWGLVVNDHVMSNVPMGQKIHKKNLAIRNERINFGKHKGKRYLEIPSDYLEWIAKEGIHKDRPYLIEPLKKLGVL